MLITKTHYLEKKTLELYVLIHPIDQNHCHNLIISKNYAEVKMVLSINPNLIQGSRS